MITLVLLPGLDGSGDFFKALCQQLSADWRTQVVRYPPDQPLCYSELASLVREALPEKSHYVLVAESFSGPVAIQVAAARPAGLIGVVLYATFARNPRPVFGPLRSLVKWAPVRAAPMGLLALWLLGTDADAAWAERIRQAMSSCSDAVLRARARAVLTVDVRNELANIGVPVLYLQATRDWVVPVTAQADMQRVFPGMSLAKIDGPHFLLQARSAACAEQIVGFVRNKCLSTHEKPR